MTNHSDTLKSLAQEAQARAADLRDWFDPGLKDIPVETLKQRYCDRHSRFIEVEGLDIHYRDLGPEVTDADKAPLLLIHGLMSSLHCWEGWMPTLSHDRRVVALDIPPFAITGPHPKGLLDEATYMQLMLGFVDAVGLERFIAVGNSLGGFSRGVWPWKRPSGCRPCACSTRLAAQNGCRWLSPPSRSRAWARPTSP